MAMGIILLTQMTSVVVWSQNRSDQIDCEINPLDGCADSDPSYAEICTSFYQAPMEDGFQRQSSTEQVNIIMDIIYAGFCFVMYLPVCCKSIKHKTKCIEECLKSCQCCCKECPVCFIVIQSVKTVLRAVILCFCIANLFEEVEQHQLAEKLLGLGCIDITSEAFKTLKNYYKQPYLQHGINVAISKTIVAAVGAVVDVAEVLTKSRIYCNDTGNDNDNDSYCKKETQKCCRRHNAFASTEIEFAEVEFHRPGDEQETRKPPEGCCTLKCARNAENAYSIIGISTVIFDAVFTFWLCLLITTLKDVLQRVFKTRTSWCFPCEAFTPKDEVLRSGITPEAGCYILTAVTLFSAISTLVMFCKKFGAGHTD